LDRPGVPVVHPTAFRAFGGSILDKDCRQRLPTRVFARTRLSALRSSPDSLRCGWRVIAPQLKSRRVEFCASKRIRTFSFHVCSLTRRCSFRECEYLCYEENVICN